MKLISKFLIAGIILGIFLSIFYIEKYEIIRGYCERNINNEILKEIIERGNSLLIETDKGIYKCNKNESNIEKIEIIKNFLNIPLNFKRFYVEDDERLKELKVDYLKEDKYYFKEESIKDLLGDEKEIKFYLIENLKKENNFVIYKNKSYSLEEFKKINDIEIISQNEEIIFKKYLFNSSCLKNFDYYQRHDVLYHLTIKIEFRNECTEKLEDELQYSLIKIIGGEKFFEFPLLIEVENLTSMQIFIPFAEKLNNQIILENVSLNPFNIENLKIIKIYSKKPQEVYEENYFKLFFIDIFSILFFILFLILLIKKIKIDFLIFLSPLIFIFKFFVIGIILAIVAYTFKKRKFNLLILPIIFSSISIFYNPSFTLFFPLLSIFSSLTRKKIFIPIFFSISLFIFFFSESLSLLFLSLGFLISLRFYLEEES